MHFCIDLRYSSSNYDTYLHQNRCKTSKSYQRGGWQTWVHSGSSYETDHQNVGSGGCLLRVVFPSFPHLVFHDGLRGISIQVGSDQFIGFTILFGADKFVFWFNSHKQEIWLAEYASIGCHLRSSFIEFIVQIIRVVEKKQQNKAKQNETKHNKTKNIPKFQIER